MSMCWLIISYAYLVINMLGYVLLCYLDLMKPNYWLLVDWCVVDLLCVIVSLMLGLRKLASLIYGNLLDVLRNMSRMCATTLR